LHSPPFAFWAIAQIAAVFAVELGFHLAPGAEVYPAKDKTKKIGRNKSELPGLNSDHANHDAVHRSQRPAFPTAFAHQDRRNNR
jgi:hypothetical protein